MRHLFVVSAVFVALTACGEDDSTADAAFEQTLESDVEDLSRSAGEVALQPTTTSACVEGLGDCSFCWEATGTPISGVFDFGAEPLPCAATWEGAAGSTTYTVQSSDFSGTWTANASGVTVQMAGTRAATLSTERRRGTQEYTSAMTLHDLTLDADTSGTVTGSTLSATYTGFGGRTFEVELVDDGATLSGTATAGTLVCTIAGTRAATTVTCAR